MTDATLERLAFRFRQVDLDNIATVAAGLRAAGRPFVRRTDVVRHALALAAAATATANAAPVAALDVTP